MIDPKTKLLLAAPHATATNSITYNKYKWLLAISSALPTPYTMPRRKNCKTCENKEAILYHPFWSNANNERLHVKEKDYNSPICSQCVIMLKREHNDALVGCLKESEKKEYIDNVKAQLYNSLIEDGAVVINDLPCIKQIINDLTIYFYSRVKEDKILLLKDSKLKDTPATTDHRVWSNIYNEDNNTATNTVHSLCSPLLTLVTPKLMPHRHYALTAHRNFTSLINNTNETLLQGSDRSIRKCSIENQKIVDNVLIVEKINVLCRGPKLNSIQTAHVDGNSMKLLLLLVDYTQATGYNFHFLPGSHNISNHNELLETKLPLKCLEEIRAASGSIIAFFENTIHSGGHSSKNGTNNTTGRNPLLNCTRSERLKHNEYIKNIKWFKDKSLPTDISFQILLRYGLITCSSTEPNKTNKWYGNITSDDGEANTPIQKELQNCSNNAQQHLRKLDKDYIQCMTLGKRASTRKR